MTVNTAASNLPSSKITLVGELEVAHSDAQDTKTKQFKDSKFEYFLKTAGDVRTTLRFQGSKPKLLSGSQVEVTGVGTRGGSLTVASAKGPEFKVIKETKPHHSARKTAVLLFKFQDDSTQAVTPATAKARTFTNSDSVNDYFQEISFGERSLIGNINLDGDVFGYYTIPSNYSGCDWYNWGKQARTAATNAGVNLSAYDHIVHVFSDHGGHCGWAGLAYLGDRTSWVVAEYYGLRVVSHELSHNFGVHHASTLDCRDADNDRVTITANLYTDCSTNEYGDPYDVMGSSGHYHENNFQKGRLLWLAAGNTVTANTDGEYTIVPMEQSNAGVQALRVALNNGYGDYYYLEYRQPFGYDDFAGTANVANGLSIRVAPNYEDLTQTLLLDMTPLTLTYTDSALTVGNTFIDPYRGVRITLNSISPTGAVVNINFDNVPPTAPSSLTATPASPARIDLAWAAATDESGVTGYQVFRGGVKVRDLAVTLAYQDQLLNPNTEYSYTVKAKDANGNISPVSESAVAMTPTDTTPPTAPTNLYVNKRTSKYFAMVWGAASDDGRVVSYRVYRKRDGVWSLLKTTPQRYYYVSRTSDYRSYYVRAVDAGGNMGPRSNIIKTR